MTVPRCERTGEVVEPMLSEQWYMAMSKPAPAGTLHPGKSIAQVALEVVARGEVNIFPEQWKTIYNNGSRISRTGASRVNCGGAIRFRRGTTSGAMCSWRAAKKSTRGRANALTRDRMCSTRGCHRRCCRFHARLARRQGQGRLRLVSAIDGARDRARHHLLLGRAHDHDDDALHRPRSVSQRLSARHDPR